MLQAPARGRIAVVEIEEVMPTVDIEYVSISSPKQHCRTLNLITNGDRVTNRLLTGAGSIAGF